MRFVCILRKGYSTTCLLLFEILQELHRIAWWIEELSVLHSSTDVSHGSSLPLHSAVGVMFTVHHLMTMVPWNKRSAFLGGTYQIFHDVSEPVGHKISKKTTFWNVRQYIPTWSKSKTTKDIHWPWKQSDTMMYAMHLEYGKIPKFSQSIELQRTQCCDSLPRRSLVKTDRANLTIFRGLDLWKLRWDENQEIMQ